MHLVFDSLVLARGRRSAIARGGIHRYAQELLRGLEQVDDLAIHPYCRDPLLARLARAPGGETTATRPVTAAGGWGQARLIRLAKPLWQALQASPPARLGHRRALGRLLAGAGSGPCVYHSPYTPVPPEVRRAGLPAVVTVHDLLPLLQPQWFQPDSRREFARILASLQRRDQVICVSQASRRDFLTLVPDHPPQHVHAIPLAARGDLAPVGDRQRLLALRQRLGVGPEDLLVLALGTLEPRKNLAPLVEAFEQVAARHPQLPLRLVIAGAQGWQTEPLLERLRHSPARQAIQLAGHIADGELASLYSTATLLAYPSLHEGFGLPPLEAMACGTPVLCADRSSLPEVVGTAALTVDPASPVALATGLERLLLEPGLAARLGRAGLERAARFSWGRTVEQTLAVYRRALET